MTKLTSSTEHGSTAILSDCERYRYLLERRVGMGEKPVLFIMLNPSTADAHVDDATIRRCRGFARAWQHGRMSVVNLFALRSVSPRAIMRADDPVGAENDLHVKAAVMETMHKGGRVVCAWGGHGSYLERDQEVLRIISQLGVATMCLGTTKNGQPRHPLYVPGNQPLQTYTVG